jgi:hypothetical protein
MYVEKVCVVLVNTLTHIVLPWTIRQNKHLNFENLHLKKENCLGEYNKSHSIPLKDIPIKYTARFTLKHWKVSFMLYSGNVNQSSCHRQPRFSTVTMGTRKKEQTDLVVFLTCPVQE